MKTSKLFSMIAGVSASALALNADAGDTYSSHNTFVGRQYQVSYSGNAPRVIVPEQNVHIKIKEGRLFPWQKTEYYQDVLVLENKQRLVELQTPCGKVYAPACIPEYVRKKEKVVDWDYKWGRNIKCLLENLKPRTSYVDVNISGSCPQPYQTPCEQAIPTPCEPVEPMPRASEPARTMPNSQYDLGYPTVPGPNYAPTENISPRLY